MLLIANKDHVHLRSTSRPACVASARYHARESAWISQAQEATGMNEPVTTGHSWIHAPRPGIRRHRTTVCASPINTRLLKI